MNFYSIYDVDSEKFSVPFNADNDALASRIFFLNTEKIPDVVKCSLELHFVFSVDDEMNITMNDKKIVMRGVDIPEWISMHSMPEESK